jgi:hypothetical protein
MEDIRRILQQQEAEQNKQILIQAKQLAKKKATEQSFDMQSREQSTQMIAIRRVYDMRTGISHKEVVRRGGQQTNTVATQPHYNQQPGPYTQPIYYPPPGLYPQQGYNTQSAEHYAPMIGTQQGYDTQSPNQYTPKITTQLGYDTQMENYNAAIDAENP